MNKVTNFGSNNYSCGMEAITLSAPRVDMDEAKKYAEENGLYLHPTLKPNQNEVFLLKGTFVQYVDFAIQCRDQEASKKAMKDLGITLSDLLNGSPYDQDTLSMLKEKYEEEFIPLQW